jgi:hypothetical protein
LKIGTRTHHHNVRHTPNVLFYPQFLKNHYDPLTVIFKV